mmetsp:Transcript_105293/g.181602  ORF Transcript_105293/g.181602 Transcript_105293/m.181602 type:complete len:273 (-) Transcript_105293:341-1159(-)
MLVLAGWERREGGGGAQTPAPGPTARRTPEPRALFRRADDLKDVRYLRQDPFPVARGQPGPELLEELVGVPTHGQLPHQLLMTGGVRRAAGLEVLLHQVRLLCCLRPGDGTVRNGGGGLLQEPLELHLVLPPQSLHIPLLLVLGDHPLPLLLLGLRRGPLLLPLLLLSVVVAPWLLPRSMWSAAERWLLVGIRENVVTGRIGLAPRPPFRLAPGKELSVAPRIVPPAARSWRCRRPCLCAAGLVAGLGRARGDRGDRLGNPGPSPVMWRRGD